MRKTTTTIIQVVEEDSFPTRPEITTTAEPASERRIPTYMLPPALQRLSRWIGGAR